MSIREVDAITLAKLIRNLECSVELKRVFINDVAKYFTEQDQFFNHKRFRAVAEQSLWPGDPGNEPDAD